MGKRKRKLDVWNRGKSYTSKSDHIALDRIFGRLTTRDGMVHVESSFNAKLGKKHSKRRLVPLVGKRLSDIQHLQQAREAYLAHNQIDINRHKNYPSHNPIKDLHVKN
jgi:hypothetical protein